MATENLHNLKIHKVSQERYNTELENHTSDVNAIYLTPESYNARTIGTYSHAEGCDTIAYGDKAHAEGIGADINLAILTSEASSIESYWEANTKFNMAFGEASHTEGKNNLATGVYAHAEGEETRALHQASHAGGRGTKTSAECQTVLGTYNDNNVNALLIVGNGSAFMPSNAFTVNKDGSATVQKQGTNGLDVATRGFVDEKFKELEARLAELEARLASLS